MTDAASKIRSAAQRNTELLAILRETDRAIPDLTNQDNYIADLSNQLNHNTRRLAELKKKHNKELKDHEKYRDSVMRRFAFKVTGKKEKFEEKAAKEEREYFDVLQEEHRETEAGNNLRQALDDAKRVRGEIAAAADRHTTAQKQLDGLYEGIFQGNTPGFPEEDAREQDRAAAQSTYRSACARAEAGQRAVNLVGEAEGRLRGAVGAMQEALKYSTRDMFGGGTFTDMMERNALHQAELQVQEAKMKIQAAQHMAPQADNAGSPAMLIHDLPPVQIAMQDLFGDIFFDNIFSDMRMHEKIENSARQVQEAHRAVSQILNDARNQHGRMAAVAKEKQDLLEVARRALQQAREDAFARVTGQGQESQGVPSDAPPAYS